MKSQDQNNIDLNKISKELPFRVPGNYFEELPERIQARCKDADKATESSSSLINILKPAFSLAAMFIGVALIAFLAVNLINQPEKQKPTFTKDIAKANYEKPYTSEEQIIKAIKEQQKNSETSEEKDEYIDYLLDDDIDYGTLINELQEKEKDTTKK
jgi:hypothetical protein